MAEARGVMAFLSHDVMLLKVVGWLDMTEIDSFRTSCKSCVEAVSESVWRDVVVEKHFNDDQTKLRAYDEKEPFGPLFEDKKPSSKMTSTGTWHSAAILWGRLARFLDEDVDGQGWIQIANSWRLIEEKLQERDSEASSAILKSLSPPATKEDLKTIGPRTLRYAYAIHDGQKLDFDEARDRQHNVGMRRSQRSIFHGLFGGFSAYDYVVVGRMAPSGQVSQCEDGSVTFAWSYRKDRRFQVNAQDDTVTVVDAEDSVEEPAAPEGASFGDWFAEYARRLETGYYDFGLVVPDDSGTESVVLFKNQIDGRECAYAKTNGVECRASALYLPAHPNGFAYSIRFNLAADAPHDHCQLKTRRWQITDVDSGRGPKFVAGEGVVGKFPRLKRGGGWRDDFQTDDINMLGFARAVRKGTERSGTFIYQSMSGPMKNPDAPNTFQGQMDFYTNEILDPKAEVFQVTVPPFLLQRPTFIF